jgi:large conductance mechanosensitive channel
MNKKEVETHIKSFIGEKEFRSYKNFAFREDMFKLTIGVILANSLNKVIYGFSDHLIMPVFKFLLSKTGDGWRAWKLSPIKGLDFEIGNLIGIFIDFILISIVLYVFFIKLVQPFLKTEEKISSKQCKYCCSMINENAKKCPLCTGDLNAEPRRTRRKNKRAKKRRSK